MEKIQKPVLGSRKLETGSDKVAWWSELCVRPPHLPQPGTGTVAPNSLKDPLLSVQPGDSQSSRNQD